MHSRCVSCVLSIYDLIFFSSIFLRLSHQFYRDSNKLLLFNAMTRVYSLRDKPAES